MLEQCRSLSAVETKKRVYDGIVKHLEIEGYPTEAGPKFNETNINDLVFGILRPVLSDFKLRTGRSYGGRKR